MTETIKFKTDVKKVMDIIIRSLYQHEEVFLRELISNASDALNKVRIKTLTSEDVYQKELPLEIQLIPNKEKGTLTIKDTGIGMTKKELVTNLGTIAQSGTLEFLNNAEGEELDELIGKFGVGFYSAFLVADKVEVRSKSYKPRSKSYVWSSEGSENFSIEEISMKERGTEIELYLKEEFKKYLEEWEVKEIVKKYSNFVAFPIKWMLEEEDESEDEEKSEDGEKSEDEEKETEHVLNSQKALWRMSPSDISDEEYTEFYRTISGKWDEPLLRLHIKMESNIEFYAVIFIPKSKPVMYTPETEWGLKLYSKKVLIQEKNQDLIPQYFRFAVGVVDSEDLPLNVSREVIQNSALTRKMKSFIEKKLIEELKKLQEEDKEKYLEFFREYGSYIKEGIASEDKNKDSLVELLRFHSTYDDVDGRTGAVSLDDYLIRMKPEQEEIFYLTGNGQEIIRKSPHLEYFEKEGLEVLLLGEPIDNFLMMHLKEYQGKKFKLIDEDEGTSTESTPAESDSEDKEEKEMTGPHKELRQKIKDVLGDKVKDVTISERLVSSPARLVTPKGGISSDFQRAMSYMENSPFSAMAMGGKILQLNPDNEIIKGIEANLENDDLVIPLINQLYSNAMLADGEKLDMGEMIENIQKIMTATLK